MPEAISARQFYVVGSSPVQVAAASGATGADGWIVDVRQRVVMCHRLRLSPRRAHAGRPLARVATVATRAACAAPQLGWDDLARPPAVLVDVTVREVVVCAQRGRVAAVGGEAATERLVAADARLQLADVTRRAALFHFLQRLPGATSAEIAAGAS